MISPIRPPELSLDSASSHLVANQEELGERSDEFGLGKYLCSYCEVIFTCREMLWHGPDGFTSSWKEGVLRILSSLKIHRLGRG
jgi:hypothetical protein